MSQEEQIRLLRAAIKQAIDLNNCYSFGDGDWGTEAQHQAFDGLQEAFNATGPHHNLDTETLGLHAK